MRTVVIFKTINGEQVHADNCKFFKLKSLKYFFLNSITSDYSLILRYKMEYHCYYRKYVFITYPMVAVVLF